MLPDFLFSTYKQYKADTDKVATWLAETARKCGYIADVDDPVVKVPKLKGRARKLARDAAAAEKKESPLSPNGPGKTPESKRYTVRVKDFVPMAEAIAKSNDASLKIPKSFVNLIKRCIQTRRGTSDWFQENDSSPDKGSIDRHLHFADILQNTLQTLIPVHELRTAQADAEKTARAKLTAEKAIEPPGIGVISSFSLLKVEEAEDAELGQITASAEVGKSLEAPMIRYEVERGDGDDGEEWFFALHCFFNDMHELRMFLGHMWATYKMGEIDLATVAVTTNAA